MKKHYVGHINRSFLMNDSASLILHTWFCMFGKHVDTFHDDSVFFSVNSDDFSLFVDIFTGNHSYHIVFLNLLSHENTSL